MTMEVNQLPTEEAQRAEWASILSKLPSGTATVAVPGADFDERVAEGVRRVRRIERARSTLASFAKFAAAAAVFAAVFAISPSAPWSARRGVLESAKESSDAEWLLANQLADGTWNTRGSRAYAPALTAIAALALSGRDGGGDAAARAIASIESMQRPDGSFGDNGTSVLYNHAFATYALVEDALRTGKGMTPAVERAVAFTLSSQDASGCWDYPGSTGGNAALTVWQAGVLASARNLGWNDAEGGLRRAVRWLARHEDGGLLDYRLALRRETEPVSGGAMLTALATASLSRYLLKYPGMEGMVAGMEASLDMATVRMAGSAGLDGRPGRDAMTVARAMISAIGRGGLAK